MSIEYVYYDLHHGFIDNWLTAGPQIIPVKDAKQIPGHEDIRLQIARHFYEKGSGIRKQPVERGPLSEGTFKIGEYEGSWLYYPCREDHFVDFLSPPRLTSTCVPGLISKLCAKAPRKPAWY